MKTTMRDKVCKLIGKYQYLEDYYKTKSAIYTGFIIRTAEPVQADMCGQFLADLNKLLEEDDAKCKTQPEEWRDVDPRKTAPAGRLIDPEKADQAVKDSVDRGAPTREIDTAIRYLILAAMSICTDSMNAFEHYLDASEEYQRENAEYMALDGRKAAAQIQSIFGVMSELEGLEEH